MAYETSQIMHATHWLPFSDRIPWYETDKVMVVKNGIWKDKR